MRALAIGLLCAACSSSGDKPAAGAKPPGAMRYPVEVAPVEARRVEYTVNAVGSIDAFERIQVTARVGGAVDRVRFQEGERVDVGQPLVEIETERYQVAVKSARAALAKAEASLADAEAGLKRREGAIAANPGLIPGEEVESYRTRVRSGQADVAAARAQLQLAELNLRDAYVRAPVAGILETRTVQTGQYLAPGTVLATLVRREPLLLRFQVAEVDAQRLQTGMTARFQIRSEETSYTAQIIHVGGAADATSRMVSIAAQIGDATSPALRPGAFAEVTIAIGASTDAPVIPQQAVRPSERGFLAFVVADGKAVERVLSLGLRTDDGRVEVRSGLKPGELLVVRGAEALKDGAPVASSKSEAAPDAGPRDAR